MNHMLVLDIGSGTPSKHHIFLKGDNVVHFDINPSAYHLEIIGDACFLPFKNFTFDVVYASHILEHLENPFKAIKEMKAMLKASSKSCVIIKVPNASFFKWKSSGNTHIFGWDAYTLFNLLSRFFPKVVIEPTIKNIGSPPRKILNLILHLFYGYNEITATCFAEPGKA